MPVTREHTGFQFTKRLMGRSRAQSQSRHAVRPVAPMVGEMPTTTIVSVGRVIGVSTFVSQLHDPCLYLCVSLGVAE